MEQRGRTRRHIPAFGEWNQQCEEQELPITQYFESAMQAGLVAAGRYYPSAGEVVLFRSSASPPSQQKPAKKVRSTMERQQQAGSRRQQGAVVIVANGAGGPRAARRARVVRAVDEDLYTVHPDLLRNKGKGRKNVRSLWMGCVGLNCVA
ncbi:hypothetical protein ACP4OV_019287 [Aristida adscensionis]